MNMKLLALGGLLVAGEMQSMTRVEKVKYVGAGCGAAVGVFVLGVLLHSWWTKKHIDPAVYKKMMELIDLQQEMIEEEKKSHQRYLTMQDEFKRSEKRQFNRAFNMMMSRLFDEPDYIVDESGLPLVASRMLLEHKQLLGDESYNVYLDRIKQFVQWHKEKFARKATPTIEEVN